MPLNHFFSVLSAIHPLPANIRAWLEEKAITLSLPRHYKLVEPPEKNRHLYFIHTGMAASFYFWKGKKYVFDFWREGDIIWQPQTKKTHSQTVEFIELTETSEVVCLSNDNLRQVLAISMEVNSVCVQLLNRSLFTSRERARQLIHLSAHERYQLLTTGMPQIEQRVSQEYIASFLGISPQSLSRIKRKHKSH